MSRRRVLTALGAGGLGALSGLGTAAVLRDDEGFTGNQLVAGDLDLVTDCQSANCVEDGGEISLALADIRPGVGGRESFTATVRGNPAWVWLAGTCVSGEFADVLRATVTVDRGCDGTSEVVESGTLAAVLRRLNDGVRVGDRCLDPDESVCVTVEWQFPDDPGSRRFEGATLDFALRLEAVQCRHHDGRTPPFVPGLCEETETFTGTGISHITVWTERPTTEEDAGTVTASGNNTTAAPASEPAAGCAVLGKLELSDAYADGCVAIGTEGVSENHIEVGQYPLPVDDDCEPTGYVLDVTETRERDGETVAVAFDLLDEHGDPGPALCKVVLFTGGERVTYEGNDLDGDPHSTGGLLSTGGSGSP